MNTGEQTSNIEILKESILQMRSDLTNLTTHIGALGASGAVQSPAVQDAASAGAKNSSEESVSTSMHARPAAASQHIIDRSRASGSSQESRSQLESDTADTADSANQNRSILLGVQQIAAASEQMTDWPSGLKLNQPNRLQSDRDTATFVPRRASGLGLQQTAASRASDFDRRFDMLADVNAMPGSDDCDNYTGQRAARDAVIQNLDLDVLDVDHEGEFSDHHAHNLEMSSQRRIQTRSDHIMGGVDSIHQGKGQETIFKVRNHDNLNINSNGKVKELENVGRINERQRQKAAISDYCAAIDGMNTSNNTNVMEQPPQRSYGQHQMVNSGRSANNTAITSGQGNQMIPMVSTLRDNNHINACVSRRLAELGIADEECEGATDTFRSKQRGKKSGLSRTVEDQVISSHSPLRVHITRFA